MVHKGNSTREKIKNLELIQNLKIILVGSWYDKKVRTNRWIIIRK